MSKWNVEENIEKVTVYELDNMWDRWKKNESGEKAEVIST